MPWAREHGYTHLARSAPTIKNTVTAIKSMHLYVLKLSPGDFFQPYIVELSNHGLKKESFSPTRKLPEGLIS